MLNSPEAVGRPESPQDCAGCGQRETSLGIGESDFRFEVRWPSRPGALGLRFDLLRFLLVGGAQRILRGLSLRLVGVEPSDQVLERRGLPCQVCGAFLLRCKRFLCQ